MAPAATPAARTSGRRVRLVTGLSGAGKSTALKAFEDFGYEVVDNLPLSLLDAIIGEIGDRTPLAIGIDVRTRDFSAASVIRRIEGFAGRPDLDLSLLFLDCDDEVLIRRFKETRRRHPLAKDRPPADGIRQERRLIAPLRDRADAVIDTSVMSPHDLRRSLRERCAPDAPHTMSVTVTSFSYGQGLPRDADLVFDVRFLRNPHYDPELRPLAGTDPPVGDHVAADPCFAAFFDRMTELLAFLLPRYEAEGKSYLAIGIGCTGGRHRSVYVAERLAAWCRDRGIRISTAHRDIERAALAAPDEEQK